MMEPKTEVIMIGHVLEKEIVFKLYDVIKDMDVDVKHCEVSFTTLKEGIEQRKPSTMRFYLVGSEEDRLKAIEAIKKLAEENDCGIETVDYEKMWKKR